MSVAPKASLPPLLTSLSDILDRYDGFILDVWGVLHDGVDAYDGVHEALQTLKAANKRVYLLSNSPMRAEKVVERALDPKGLTADLYTGILSSGEVAYEHMHQHWQNASIYRFWHEEHASSIATMPHRAVTNVHEADVLFASLIPHGVQEDEYDPILEQAIARKLPLVCANPDRAVNLGNDIHFTTGTFAERYQAMGGHVTWIGKPHALVYDRILKAIDLPKDKILAIGDSLHTDVGGAVNAGIDVAWNLPGIHWEEVRASGPLAAPNPLRLAKALTSNAHPTYMLMGLKV